MGVFRWFAAVMLASLAASAAYAEHGVVVTLNGQTFEGELVEEANVVTVVRQGMRTRIPRNEIQTMRVTGDPTTEINKEREKLERDDIKGRLVLSRRAFQIRNYDLSRTLAEEAAKIDPNNRDAADLLQLIRRQVAMEESSANTARAQRTQRTVGGAADASLAIPVVLMDERDMNALRQAELQAGDENNLRVRFNNDVRRRFVSLPETQAASFAELTAFQQAVTLIREGSAKMRQDVLLSGDPTAIRSFRAVQKSILIGCAATQCHGSMAGGNFVLFPLADTDAVTYTNFYLLMKYARINREQPTAVFGGGGARVRMVDRQRPGQSLLLQYGLPPNLAETPHPNVPGFKAMFNSVDDAVYGRMFSWIRDGLRPVDVSYEVNYISPVQALSHPGEVVDTNPTTAPATRPATKPATRPATTSTPVSRPATTTRGPVSIPMPSVPGEAAPPVARPKIPMPGR